MRQTREWIMKPILMIMIVLVSTFWGTTQYVKAQEEQGFLFEPYQDAATGQSGVVITGYQAGQSIVQIPEELNGQKVLKLAAAFQGNTTITDVILPDSLLEIGENTFAGCSNLNHIDFASDQEHLSDYNGKVIFPAQLRSLGDHAFDQCTSVKEVFLNAALTNVGTRSFYQCTALRRFSVDAANTTYEADDYGVLYQRYVGEDTSSYTGTAADPNAITYHLVRWPIALPVNTFDFSANGGYYPMKGQLTAIDDYACENVDFSGTGLRIAGVCYRIGDYAFNACRNLSGGVVFAPECATSVIGNYAFYGNETIHEMTLPATVKAVGSYCFSMCTNLDTVIFSQGITTIGEGAFKGCRTLHTINVPEGITTIAKDTFAECVNLGTVVLPESLKRIEENAFKDCVTIHEMVMPANVEYVAENSFAGVDVNKIDFKENINIGIQLGADVPEPIPNRKSILLKQGKKATIKWTLNGDSIASYQLDKASRKKIKVNKRGVITARKKGKTGLAVVQVTMNSKRVYKIKVYVTKSKIYPVRTKKPYTVKLHKTLQLSYGADPLAVTYQVPKKAKSYVSVNRYGKVTAKKLTQNSKPVIIKVIYNGTVTKQKIVVARSAKK